MSRGKFETYQPRILGVDQGGLESRRKLQTCLNDRRHAQKGVNLTIVVDPIDVSGC